MQMLGDDSWPGHLFLPVSYTHVFSREAQVKTNQKNDTQHNRVIRVGQP